MPTAISGFNGRNETFIGNSYGLDLSFLDEAGAVIPVQNLYIPIELWIPRSTTLSQDAYQYVNTTNLTVSSSFQIMPNAMNISSTNASLHIQLSPQDFTLAYLILVKFGSTPYLNSTASSYDFWKVFCPNSSDFYSIIDNITGTLDQYYLFFLDMNAVNGYKGFVGYGVRELSSFEKATYCANSSSSNSSSIPSSPPLFPPGQNVSYFSNDFSLKTYTSGCYYYSTNTGKWDNMGMEIYADTTIFMTHCNTNHLTQFAGGLIALPSQLNFVYFAQNASPAKNPSIYIVVLSTLAIYIICLAWAYRADILEEKRLGINILADNLFGDVYSYEVTIFTGSRKDAGTESKVIFSSLL